MRKNLRANNKNILAIDASRNRSGGARAHLVKLNELTKMVFDEVHFWSYKNFGYYSVKYISILQNNFLNQFYLNYIGNDSLSIKNLKN